MNTDYVSAIKKLFGIKDKQPKGEDIFSDNQTEDKEEPSSNVLDTASSYALSLINPISAPTGFYFPADLIGGCCPRIQGEEQSIVWNAAAEASDSERVHMVWQSYGERIWYIAVRSAELGSYPDTWCPFAAMLPGMKDAAAPPAIYTYYSDEAATMMTVTEDGLQIHRGLSSVIRAKAERTSRELNGAKVIEITPDLIDKLTVVPWYSLSLFEDRVRRVLAAASVLGAVVVAAVSAVIWLVVSLAIVGISIDMDDIRKRSEEKSLSLVKSVQETRTSPMRDQIAKFAELNDGLLNINGLLEIYSITNGKVLWRAVVPSNVTSDRIKELGGQTLENLQQGVVIGNSREALNMDDKDRGRRK